MEQLFNIFSQWGMSESAAKVVSFFIFETFYLSILLLIGLTVFTFIRVKFLGDDFAKKLENKPKALIYLGMALLGIVSPFCSCSTIPVFVSLSALGIPTGALFTYLIVSPLVQETSLILLMSEFGLAVTVIYVLLGVLSGLLVGMIISKVKDSKLFTEDVLAKRENKKVLTLENNSSCGCGSKEEKKEPESKCGCSSSCGAKVEIDSKKNPMKYSINEAVTTMKKTFKYIVIGIAFGSFIYGVVPDSTIQNLLGTSNEVAPVIATVIGIPIYADDVSLIPIAKTLVDAGAGLGTSLSFVMASAVVSIPSFIMLSAALKKQTIIKLVVFLTTAIIGIGYLFNLLQPFIV